MTGLPAAELVRRAGPTRSVAAEVLGVTPRTLHRWLCHGVPVARCDTAAARIGCHELELWTEAEIATATRDAATVTAHRRARAVELQLRNTLAALLGKPPSTIDYDRDLAALPPRVASRYARDVSRRVAT